MFMFNHSSNKYISGEGSQDNGEAVQRNQETKSRGARRPFHDDITIVVVFIDDDNTPAPELSVRGFVDHVGPSNFNSEEVTDEPQRSRSY